MANRRTWRHGLNDLALDDCLRNGLPMDQTRCSAWSVDYPAEQMVGSQPIELIDTRLHAEPTKPTRPWMSRLDGGTTTVRNLKQSTPLRREALQINEA